MIIRWVSNRRVGQVVITVILLRPLAAAVGRITKYFNSEGTPLISVGGSTYDFEQKKTDCGDEFYMLLRTGTLSFESLSELTINVMKQ